MKKRLYLISPLAQNFPKDGNADYMGVDAGYKKILEAGLPCTLALGDFDSLESESVSDSVKKIVLPVHKDETDGQKAMETAISNGYNDIIFWGGLSGRLDHTLANLRLIVWDYPQVILQDENHKAQTLLPGQWIFDPDWKHISFFAMESSILSLEGFEYNLQDCPLNEKDMFTVSNKVTAPKAKATVKKGRILCIQSQFR